MIFWGGILWGGFTLKQVTLAEVIVIKYGNKFICENLLENNYQSVLQNYLTLNSK